MSTLQQLREDLNEPQVVITLQYAPMVFLKGRFRSPAK
ncbi:hypothetical protein SAMN05421690_101452 [Nitrosomonas sp. Nm51]|nr:hypothetical protein SAMN05421690_101452 [Nitrosomonas sp. Nm51]